MTSSHPAGHVACPAGSRDTTCFLHLFIPFFIQQIQLYTYANMCQTQLTGSRNKMPWAASSVVNMTFLLQGLWSLVLSLSTPSLLAQGHSDQRGSRWVAHLPLLGGPCIGPQLVRLVSRQGCGISSLIFPQSFIQNTS